ncbi:unnamed protein product [Timema podura]|uniref:Uncharacterized protein n=1 Tax=Timema podura TaxID=61482 RepID=A0ABN7P6E3_TIMPD|nr:unnamed protein product [Timema podura]
MSLVDVGITSAGSKARAKFPMHPSVLESDPPMVLSSPSAPQEEEEEVSPKAEWILPSTKSQGISGGGGCRIVLGLCVSLYLCTSYHDMSGWKKVCTRICVDGETFEDPSGVSKNSSEVSKDPSDVSKDPSEVFKDPSEVPQESPPTHRDSVAESYKPQPQSQSFELTTSL